MKKLFALVATLMLSVSAYAAQFKEGEHYQVLKTPPLLHQSSMSFSHSTARTVTLSNHHCSVEAAVA